MTGKYLIETSDNSFDKDVIQASKKTPIVVDFWASWCGPCRMLGPILEKLADEYNGKIIVAKLSVEENEGKPQEYEVMSIPAVKMFKDGKVVDEFIGAIPESRVREFIDRNLD